MLIGVDHVALTVPHISAGVIGAKAFGREPRFVIEKLPNASEKKPFLWKYLPEHAIAYCRGGDRVAIECVCHHEEMGSAIAPYELSPYHGGEILNVLCHDIERSGIFWRGLGFKQTQHVLRFSARFPHWELSVALMKDRKSESPPYLDSRGFSCVALISTSLEKDVGMSLDYGGHSPSAPFKLHVNDHDLRIALLRGPSDEIVEFIQIQEASGA